MEGWLILALGVGVIIALYLLYAGIMGAIFLCGWACENGFLGLAAYKACWVFFSPGDGCDLCNCRNLCVV
jgi:hypothetical protein